MVLHSPRCGLPGGREGPEGGRHLPQEGLKGTGGNKKVTVEGLIQYVKDKLPDLTEKYRGAAQYPVSWGTGMDFPIDHY